MLLDLILEFIPLDLIKVKTKQRKDNEQETLSFSIDAFPYGLVDVLSHILEDAFAFPDFAKIRTNLFTNWIKD